MRRIPAYSMDSRTIQYYVEHAQELAARYEGVASTAARHARDVFPPGGRILDVGFGSGRDLQALLDAGFDADGVDACPTFVADALGRHPQLQGRVRQDRFPELSTIADESRDGVLCWAVLMHVPKDELFDTLFHLRRVLRPGGVLLMSTPLVGPATDPDTGRAEDGRLFNGVAPEQFQFLFERVGFRRVNRWDSPDTLGRADRTWSTQAFIREAPHACRLETIEAIPNQDRKDAK